jgi:predicted nucleic acid-binding protein
LTTCYLDASAIVKLAARESESEALRKHLADCADRITSRLSTVEVPRALARRGRESFEAGETTPAEILERLLIVELDSEIAVAAAALEPPTLRSLVAIHLASAVAVVVEEVVTYDERLARAARAAGLKVLSPA